LKCPAIQQQHGCLQVPKQGLQTPFRGGLVLDVAKQIIAISRGGLERRGQDETGFLRKLEAIVESGENQADQLAQLYKTEWGESVDPVYDYMAF
jgi:glutamate--cysteine ligase